VAELFDWLISVDDHVVEPPHIWQDRLPAKYREVGPRVVKDEQGEAWLYEATRNPTTGLSAAAGKAKEEFSPAPLTYEEMRPGCYDSKARLEDMDRDGVLSSLCFPTMPRFCGQLFSEGKDKDLGLACVQAYNDWMIEEWSGSAPGRFIPMIILPLWDARLAATEVERTAGIGAKAIAFSENPHALGLPSIHDRDGYWDPLWSAAQDTGMPICCHIGSSSKLPTTSPDAPFIVSVVLTPMNAAWTCVDWLFSGLFIRFPRLKLCLSEGGIGWIPYVLERCEYSLDRQGAWSAKKELSLEFGDTGVKVIMKDSDRAANYSVPPTQLFRDHIFGCFIDDEHGSRNIDLIGVDNVMIETDYPHTDSTWPNSMENAKRRLAGRSDEDIEKILRGNAKRVFQFEPARPPARAG
jgi:predicted TIM-barrel fold metal-dependent hydrolase